MDSCQQPSIDQTEPGKSNSSTMASTTQLQFSKPSCTSDLGHFPAPKHCDVEFDFNGFQKLGNDLSFSMKALERTHLSKLNFLARVRHEIEGLQQKRRFQKAAMEDLQTNLETLAVAKKAAVQRMFADRKRNLDYLQAEFDALSEIYYHMEDVVGKILTLLEEKEAALNSLLDDMKEEHAVMFNRSSNFDREIETTYRMYFERNRKSLEEKDRNGLELLQLFQLLKIQGRDKEIQIEWQQKMSSMRFVQEENGIVNGQILEINGKLRELEMKIGKLSMCAKANLAARKGSLEGRKSKLDSSLLQVKSLTDELEIVRLKLKLETEENERVNNHYSNLQGRIETITSEIRIISTELNVGRNDKLEKFCHDVESNNAPLADILSNAEKQISAEHTKMIELLKSMCREADGKESEVESHKECLVDMKVQMDKLKIQMEEKTKGFEEVERKSNDLKARIVELDAGMKLKEMEAKLNKTKYHFKVLEKKMSSTRESSFEALQEIKALKQEIARMDNNISALPPKDEEGATKIMEQDQRLNELMEAIVATRRDVKDFESKMGADAKQDVEAEINKLQSDMEVTKTEQDGVIAQLNADLHEAQKQAQEELNQLQVSYEESVKPLAVQILQNEENIALIEEELASHKNLLFTSTQMTIEKMKERLSLVERLIEKFGDLEGRKIIKNELSRSLQMSKINEHLASTFLGINECLEKSPFQGSPSYAIYRRRLDHFMRQLQELEAGKENKFTDGNYQNDIAEWAYMFSGIRNITRTEFDDFSSPDFDY